MLLGVPGGTVTIYVFCYGDLLSFATIFLVKFIVEVAHPGIYLVCELFGSVTRGKHPVALGAAPMRHKILEELVVGNRLVFEVLWHDAYDSRSGDNSSFTRHTFFTFFDLKDERCYICRIATLQVFKLLPRLRVF